jgi:hypothetical protein
VMAMATSRHIGFGVPALFSLRVASRQADCTE